MDLSRHRVLYNGDWGTLFWSPRLWQPQGGPYSVKAIHSFVDLLADSGVDTLVISPNTQVAWYPSKVVPTALDGYTRGHPRWSKWLNRSEDLPMMDRYLDLLEAGIDWLAALAARCRERGISPWVSVRMNDMHGAADPAGNPINCPLFADPRYRLSGQSIDPAAPPRPYWQALSYEQKAVRDYMFAMIRELVLDYDYEGLELDWLRNPAICEPNASEDTIATLLTWLGEIRTLTEVKARATGRSYPLGLRVPAQFAMLRSIGLDVVTAARRGLFDFICPSNLMQTTWDLPHDRLRDELGEGVTIYGVIELILNGVQGYDPAQSKSYDRYPCANAATLRGNAAGKLALGADGIELYNYYAADEDSAERPVCTRQNMRADYAAIAGIADLAALRGMPKHYALNTLFAPCWYPPFDWPEPLPQTLPPLWRRAFRLPMCAEPTAQGLELVVQLVLEAPAGDLPPLGVSLNGSWPSFSCVETRALLVPNRPATQHMPAHRALDYRFDVGLLREGWNEVTVYNAYQETYCSENRQMRTFDASEIGAASTQSGTVRIASIELAVQNSRGDDAP